MGYEPVQMELVSEYGGLSHSSFLDRLFVWLGPTEWRDIGHALSKETGESAVGLRVQLGIEQQPNCSGRDEGGCLLVRSKNREDITWKPNFPSEVVSMRFDSGVVSPHCLFLVALSPQHPQHTSHLLAWFKCFV